MIANGVYRNDDGLISYREAELTESILLPPSGISDLTGLEAFVNLDSFSITLNPLLEELNCGRNSLHFLDISMQPTLQLIGIDHMPMLTEVCVWTLPFPPEGVVVLQGFSPNVNFITSCNR